MRKIYSYSELTVGEDVIKEVLEYRLLPLRNDKALQANMMLFLKITNELENSFMDLVKNVSELEDRKNDFVSKIKYSIKDGKAYFEAPYRKKDNFSFNILELYAVHKYRHPKDSEIYDSVIPFFKNITDNQSLKKLW